MSKESKINISYDSDRGTTSVDVSNTNDLELCNAMSNLCSAVTRTLVKNGMTVEMASRKMAFACATGITAAGKEMGDAGREEPTYS